jgi:hypothetical protein
MLKKILSCPSNCKCSRAIKKLFKESNINIVSLTKEQQEERTKIINEGFKSISQEEIKQREEYFKSIDRRDRCD